MKKLLFILTVGLMLSACSNDFEVTAPWKEIPVVYGILSPQDTAHYIRIEKAFLDPEVSALTIAKIADSLYYPESAIMVFLERTDNQNRLQFQRVNGALEGYPRKDGVFATEPNWLYKAKSSPSFPLDPGKTYRLVIERADGKPNITAETTLPAPFVIVKPSVMQQVPIIGFEKLVPPTPVSWRTDENAYFFNITFKIRYLDKNANGTTAAANELVWLAAKNVPRGEATSGMGGLFLVSRDIARNSFYNFLAQNLQRPVGNMYREFQTLDILIEGGGREIKEYLDTADANGGLTGAEVFPNYSNISEGFGIFTGKNQVIGQNIRLTTNTVDSMNANSITDTLRFRY